MPAELDGVPTSGIRADRDLALLLGGQTVALRIARNEGVAGRFIEAPAWGAVVPCNHNDFLTELPYTEAL